MFGRDRMKRVFLGRDLSARLYADKLISKLCSVVALNKDSRSPGGKLRGQTPYTAMSFTPDRTFLPSYLLFSNFEVINSRYNYIDIGHLHSCTQFYISNSFMDKINQSGDKASIDKSCGVWTLSQIL